VLKMPPKKRRGKKEEPADRELLTLDQAAAALGVSRSTLYRWQNEGRIRGSKVGRQWRFRRSDLDKFGQMSHPSAAAVKVPEVRDLAAALRVPPKELAALTLEPAVPDYPATEQEKAVYDLFKGLLVSAMKAKASDIHIDPARGATIIRERVDGVLHEVMQLPRSAHAALVSCVKGHAGIPLDQQQTPQDGRFHATSDDREHDIRAATIPSVYGESVVMRLLARVHELASLDQLGMYPDDLERYRRALRCPTGLLIVAGPTGSGKTTALYAGLLSIVTPEIKILSVEDPVEVALPHVTQTGVNRKAGFTFEAAQRAFMRHDPDVLLVGTLQSLEGAELATQAAITGHLVMSTLHASTAAGAVTRLFDMGVAPFMLAETLVCIVAMRLARKVCPECSQPDEPDFHLLSPLAERARAGGYRLPETRNFIRGAGCDHCLGTGYSGRTGLYEVMEVDHEIRRLVAARAPDTEIEEAAVRNGMTTLAADGLRKAADGITSVFEAMRVTPKD
jgi:excisionase family DNA binding protein